MQWICTLLLTLTLTGVSYGSQLDRSDLDWVPDAAGDHYDTFFKNHTWTNHKEIVIGQYLKLSETQKETLTSLPKRTFDPAPSAVDSAAQIVKQLDQAPSAIYVSGIVRQTNIINLGLLAKKLAEFYEHTQIYVLVNNAQTGWLSDEHVQYVYDQYDWSGSHYAATLYQGVFGEHIAASPLSLPEGKWGLQQFVRGIPGYVMPKGLVLSVGRELTEKNLRDEGIDTSSFTIACIEPNQQDIEKAAQYEYKQLERKFLPEDDAFTVTDLDLLLKLDHIIAGHADAWRKTHP